jgi:hypothetical protein
MYSFFVSLKKNWLCSRIAAFVIRCFFEVIHNNTLIWPPQLKRVLSSVETLSVKQILWEIGGLVMPVFLMEDTVIRNCVAVPAEQKTLR